MLKRAGVNEFKRLGEVPGAELEGLQLAHPFYDRTVPVVLGDHVTLDAGTGARAHRARSRPGRLSPSA